MSEKITLSGVPETMLQTVYARAKETKTRGAITDNKAVEIIDRLDYDFSMADKDAAMHSGVSICHSHTPKNKHVDFLVRCFRNTEYLPIAQ